MRDAVVLPLLVFVLVDRSVVGFIGNGSVGEHPFVRCELRQDLVAKLCSDEMRVFHIYLHAHRVVTHLPDLALAKDVQILDHLKDRFPIPYVRAEFEVLRTHVMQCEAHISKKSPVLLRAFRTCTTITIIDL